MKSTKKQATAAAAFGQMDLDQYDDALLRIGRILRLSDLVRCLHDRGILDKGLLTAEATASMGDVLEVIRNDADAIRKVFAR